MAETATVGELLVRIRADMSDLERGIAKASGLTTAFASRATPGLRTIENAMRGLAFQAAGIPGPIGRISAALLTMSAGGTVTLAVVAGIGAIALAWRSLTKDAREATKAQTQALRAAFETPFLKAKENLQLVKQALADAGTEAKKWSQSAPFSDVARQKLDQAMEQMKQATEAVKFWTLEVDRLDEAWQQVLDRIEGVAAPERLKIPGLTDRAGLSPFVVGRSIGEALAGIKPKVPHLDVSAAIAADRWLQKFAKEIKNKQDLTRAIGESIGESIAAGMNAVLGRQNFFKAFFNALLNIGISIASAQIGNVITRGLNKAFQVPTVEPSRASAGGLGGLTIVDFANAPPATNPLASARDAQLQRWFRETALVARQEGFRFG